MSNYFGISSDAAGTLFSSLNSSSSASNMSYLSDYASIKNGSYQKLIKSYYAKQDKTDTTPKDKTTEETSATKKQLMLLKNDATDLYKSAKKLTDGNTKDIKAFVDDYNSLIDSASKSDAKTITRNTDAITNATKLNSELLAKIGISVGTDNKLKLDEDAFKDADDSNISTLFKGMNSYASGILNRTSNVFTSTVNEMNKTNSYDSKGSYSNIDNIGNLYNSLF